jgi:DNA-binding transcriptional MerR regulator
MFKIREFARFTRVSVKMLRHYDEIGLLRPARVDAATGYRYYSAEQVTRLNRLIALKDLGFSLEQIAGLLNDDVSPEEIRGMLKLRRAEIEGQLRVEHERLAQVEAHLRLLDRPAPFAHYDVVLREAPAQWVASLRQTIGDEDAITRMFEELEDFLAQHRARAAYSPLTIYHDAGPNDDEQEVETAVPVNRPLPATERITVYELPRVPLAACVVYEGSYARGAEALHALSLWIEHNRYAITGPMREVYLRFGANDSAKLRLPPAFLTEDSRQYVTEIQLPVEKH